MQGAWRPSTPSQTIPRPTGRCQDRWCCELEVILWQKVYPNLSPELCQFLAEVSSTSSNPPVFHCIRATIYMSSEIKSAGAENHDSLQPSANQQAFLSKPDTPSSFQAVKRSVKRGQNHCAAYSLLRQQAQQAPTSHLPSQWGILPACVMAHLPSPTHINKKEHNSSNIPRQLLFRSP